MAKPMPYKGIQLTQLRSFCVVAGRANFTEAAEILGLSVPAVWQQVRSLEREMGTPLFQRVGRAVSITAEGKLLADMIQPYVNGLESLFETFQQKKADIPQQLSLATTYYAASFHLVEPVREFVASHPSVRLSLYTGMGLEPLEILSRQQAHFGLISFDPEEARHPQMDYEDLYTLDYTLLTPKGHPLSRKRKVTPADLVSYPHIITPRQGLTFETLERLLRRHGLLESLDVAMDCRYTELILKYVGLGLGIALVYMNGKVRQSLDLVHARVYDPELRPMNVALVARKHYRFSEPMEAFRELLRKHLYDPAALAKK